MWNMYKSYSKENNKKRRNYLIRLKQIKTTYKVKLYRLFLFRKYLISKLTLLR